MNQAATSDSPTPLMTASELRRRLDDSGETPVLVLDCRFRLDQPAWGEQVYLEGHIPGAAFLDLDKDLSSPVIAGVTGRHPLPDPDVLTGKLVGLGLNADTTVVVYDDGPGFFAARAWWLLRWLGHEAVVVLNGGLEAWQAISGELETGFSAPAKAGDFKGQINPEMTVSVDEVVASLNLGRLALIDARAEPRFRGEVEPIDPVAGHIPGAVCLPCDENLGENGKFLDGAQLARRFSAVGDDNNRVCYCGSGVTACHNILAAAVAGLPLPRLYPGSWSEWITQPDRPVATGV